MDSAYEYMFKAAYMFKDKDYAKMWEEAKATIYEKLYNKEVKIFHDFGGNVFPSLAAFYPGVLALANDTEVALDVLKTIMRVWDTLGVLPESAGVSQDSAWIANEGYPLRPEFPESLYHAFKKTGKEFLLDFGEKVVNTLERTRQKCGFAAISNVRNFVVKITLIFLCFVYFTH